VWRLYSLQIADFETWQDWAIRQHVSELQIASERGPVLDRNGKPLAVSVPAESVYVRPKQIVDRHKTARELARLLDMKVSDVVLRLQTKQPFVWVKRQIPRFQAEKLSQFALPGVGTVLESRRFYPYNQASSAVWYRKPL
jgi:cell division protein FtsI/penicillin-binding protein 2